nr:hypothetical protein [Frigoribacterium sp. PvP032]
MTEPNRTSSAVSSPATTSSTPASRARPEGSTA